MEIKKQITGPLGVNTYIITDSLPKEAVIIDLGGDFDTIYEELTNKGYKIKFILNTHGHFDHVLGEGGLNETHPEIPIYMHKDDEYHLNNIEKELKIFGINQNVQKPQITEYIDENSKLSIGENEIKILHTPGHSKGSLSYLIGDYLFSGDTLFYMSIGRTDFIDGDYDELINSIRTKILTLDDKTTIYPGHGPETMLYKEKNFNQYVKIM